MQTRVVKRGMPARRVLNLAHCRWICAGCSRGPGWPAGEAPADPRERGRLRLRPLARGRRRLRQSVVSQRNPCCQVDLRLRHGQLAASPVTCKLHATHNALNPPVTLRAYLVVPRVCQPRRVHAALLHIMDSMRAVISGRTTGWKRRPALLLVVAITIFAVGPVAGQGLLASLLQPRVTDGQMASQAGTTAASAAAPAPRVPVSSTTRAAPPATAPPLKVIDTGKAATAADVLERLQAQARNATAEEMRQAIQHWRQTPAQAEAMGLPRVAGAQLPRVCRQWRPSLFFAVTQQLSGDWTPSVACARARPRYCKACSAAQPCHAPAPLAPAGKMVVCMAPSTPDVRRHQLHCATARACARALAPLLGTPPGPWGRTPALGCGSRSVP